MHLEQQALARDLLTRKAQCKGNFEPCDGGINASVSGIFSIVLSVALTSAERTQRTCEVKYKYDCQVCYLIRGPRQLHLSQQPLPSLQLLE